MSKGLGKRFVLGLGGVLAGTLIAGAAARAEVTADLSGTIVVYPKVVWKDGRDTIIQLANTSNSLTHVRCFYIDASPVNPELPVSAFNPRRWQVTDFELWLTKQQPYHWVISQGRPVNPSDPFGTDGAGLDAGAIPPVPPNFEGELKCVAVDSSGVPLASNNLKGEAVIRRSDGDVSKYSAISILAADGISDDFQIRLNNGPATDDGFDGGIEANSCHDTILLDHMAAGVPDPVVRSLDESTCGGACSDDGSTCSSDADCSNGSCIFQCPIQTRLTMVPCDQDLENVIPSRVTVQFDITNELEQRFSASTTVDCWLDVGLADIAAPTGFCSDDPSTSCASDSDCSAPGFCVKAGPLSVSTLGTPSAYTQITPVDLDGGVIAIAEQLHRNGAPNFDGAWAAWNLQAAGEFFDVEGRGRYLPLTRVDTTGGAVIDVLEIR